MFVDDSRRRLQPKIGRVASPLDQVQRALERREVVRLPVVQGAEHVRLAGVQARRAWCCSFHRFLCVAQLHVRHRQEQARHLRRRLIFPFNTRFKNPERLAPLPQSIRCNAKSLTVPRLIGHLPIRHSGQSCCVSLRLGIEIR